MKNHVFIATSLDGYIADKEEKLDWLPNPEEGDLGFTDFINKVDALVMGTNTFNLVCSFDCEWPYSIPVFVASNSLKSIPKKFQDKVILVKGHPYDIVKKINSYGHKNLYIDGGITIQNFLKEDLIDEITITIIPVLLGEGKKLFGNLSKRLNFKCIESKVLGNIVQSHYIRDK